MFSQVTTSRNSNLRAEQDEAREKALHGFCEEIRRKGGVPWRTAIVDDDRKDFFRGKDLQRYVEANPGKLEGIVDTGALIRSWPCALQRFALPRLHLAQTTRCMPTLYVPSACCNALTGAIKACVCLNQATQGDMP